MPRWPGGAGGEFIDKTPRKAADRGRKERSSPPERFAEAVPDLRCDVETLPCKTAFSRSSVKTCHDAGRAQGKMAVASVFSLIRIVGRQPVNR